MRGGGVMRLVGAAPVTVPMLAAVVLFVVWTPDEVGFDATTWLPGTLGVLVLIGICAWLIPTRLGDVPRAVWIALAAFTAFTLWNFVTISWADDQGLAWESANRTLLYLAVFALFALWRQRGEGGALVLGLWTLALVVFAAVTAVRLGGADARELFTGQRLSEPAGYPNAAAALWLMALWPALALAGTRRVPWIARGLLAGGAVLLCGLALLTLSRGAALATPIVLVASFVVLGDRVRRMLVVAPIAIAVALIAPTLLDVSDALQVQGGDPSSALAAARDAMLLAAAAVGLVVAIGAAVDAGEPLSEGAEQRTHRALGVTGLAGAAVALLVGLAIVGNPVDRVNSAWDSFKGGYGENVASAGRLTSGLGSNRYDFYRVGLNVFLEHPLGGVGGDNFGQDYLVARANADETPRYPHSVEIRTLSQTGIVGVLLLLAAVGAALWAALAAARTDSGLRRAVAAGAIGAFAYWGVHGSADWFWEFAGLSAPAWALLGLACSLAPRPPDPYLGLRPALGSRPAAVAGAVVLVLAAVSLGAPWLAARDVEEAAKVWPKKPGEAFARLDRAGSTNPLSDRPALIEGSIALRLGDVERADRAFAEALARNPRAAYPALERGAIASARGDAAAARRWLDLAQSRNPRDDLTRRARAVVADGKRIDVDRLNAVILGQAKVFTR